MRTAPAILLILSMLSFRLPCARAVPVPGPDVPAPATQPATGDDVAGLIARLADPDFRVRREATAALRERGAAALPRLREAAQDKNPEIRARAAQIVRVLEYRPVPGRPRPHGIARQRGVNVRIENGRKWIDVDDFGRHIEIADDADGIQMTVAGETNGQPDTQTYRARTAEELKGENPEAYAVYQRFAHAGGADLGGLGAAGVAGGNIIVQGNGNLIVIPRFQAAPMILPQGGDDVAALQQRLDDQMNKSNVPPVQRARVHNALDRVRQTSVLDPAAAPLDGEDDHVARYDKACDDLRSVLKDLNLPDPGDALPPPKSARLGVNVGPDPATGSIVVAHVLPHSRAERLGLQDDDLIRKINGKPIADVKELRRIVTETPKGLVVDITRDGRNLKLEEPGGK